LTRTQRGRHGRAMPTTRGSLRSPTGNGLQQQRRRCGPRGILLAGVARRDGTGDVQACQFHMHPRRGWAFDSHEGDGSRVTAEMDEAFGKQVGKTLSGVKKIGILTGGFP